MLANQGRERHYGLRGMPERAALIEGTLATWSEVAGGTEVELRLPACRAYAQPPTRSWLSRVGAIRCLLLAVVLLGPASSHAQQLTQYAHTAWRFQEGVFDASPVSIAQTTDGFLWIGTLNGLIRFDGARFESWNDRLHELHTCCALSLLGSSDGSLWIGTSAGLAKLNGGKLSAVTNGDGRYNRMIEDRTGRIWAVRSRIRDNKGPLCEVEGTQVRCHGKHDGFGCPFGNALAQDNAGTVWVGGRRKGL